MVSAATAPTTTKSQRMFRAGTPQDYRPRNRPSSHEDVGAAGSLRSNAQFLEHRVDGDDVALELQLRVRQPGGDADQLREMQDRHLEVLAGRLLQLRLPGVEREVAQRAGGHHRVGPGLLRLLDRLDQLLQRRLLAGLDDREAAALDLRRVVDGLAAARLDDPLE